MEINILITSVSRKVWLIEALREAMREEGVSGRVISADMNPLSAGLYLSDGYYLVSPVRESNFIPEIREICEKENIKLLIPTRDEELLILSNHKADFKKCGTEILVSEPDVIRVCRDKYSFYEFLMKNNISAPDTYLPDQINHRLLKYPLIVKSRIGSGSKEVYRVRNEEELKFFSARISEPIIQECVEGTEYTVDLFSDYNKNVISVVPRERVETVSGESYKGRTIRDKEMTECSIKFAETIGITGSCCLQYIKNGTSLKLIEVNCRLGGASILSFKSGHNVPLWLIRLLLGKKVVPQIGSYKDNLIMLKYLKELFISGNEITEKVW